MKRSILVTLFLLLIVLPVHAVGATRKPQRQTWYERALNQVNPTDKDFGAVWEERKRAFIVQLGNPYFQYSVGTTGGLVLLLTVVVAQFTSHRRALVVAAQSLADVLRHDRYSRKVAREAIHRYNEHIESCNRVIESGGESQTKHDAVQSSELLATREENKALRDDIEKRSRMIAEMSLQFKKGHPPTAQIALDFVPPDYIARINELEKQLAAEKVKNQRQKGTSVDAHRA
jgi:alkylated DNA nucleotide flippase Atl1